MIITEELILKAKALGACSEALDWLQEKPRTLDELVEYNVDWAVWAYDENLLPANIAQRYRDANGNLFCTDCVGCYNCYNCFGCVNCTNCYHCRNCHNCVNCYDCSNCKNKGDLSAHHP